MAFFRRSIRFKIFGITAALLAAMVLTSFWSAWSISRVNLQLATLSEALFPISLTIEDLRAALLREQAEIGRAGNAICTGDFARRAVNTNRLIVRAQGYRDHGAAIAQLQQNKLKFAELGPALAALAEAHNRLISDARALCGDSRKAMGAELLVQTRANDIELTLERMNDDLAIFVRNNADTVQDNERRALLANLALVLTAAVAGLYLAFLVTRGLTRPIHHLRDGAVAVQAGRLDAEVAVTTDDEIADVARAFNAMLVDLRAKEEITATFGRYVDPRIVARLIEGGKSASVAGEKQRVTVFFSDLVGFTPIADRLSPGGLVNVMNAYFTQMSEAIREHDGIIDKYIGDAVMAFWVPPFVSSETQAIQACAAALAQFDRLEVFREALPDLMGLRRDLPTMDIRIGLTTGDAIVGSIGSEVAKSFTVMGDIVNAGARLESANRFYGTRILIDEATRQLAGDAIVTRQIDHVRLKGRGDDGAIHELRAMRGRDRAEGADLEARYAEAWKAYVKANWTAACKGFSECLKIAPDDGPARVMIERIDRLAADPPAEWSGIWTFETK